MKKILTFVLTAALVLALVPTAFAHGNHNGKHQPAEPQTCRFADENKDGICDSCGRCFGKNAVDQNGDGICDNCGEACDGHWTDEDGDGICDRCGRNPGEGSCGHSCVKSQTACGNHRNACGRQTGCQNRQGGGCHNR